MNPIQHGIGFPLSNYASITRRNNGLRALYNNTPTLYGFNRINDNEGPLADQFEFVGTWEEVEAYAKKHA
jgi:hypothetical protein